MIRPPPRPTRPYTLVPYTPLFRSPAGRHRRDARALPPPPRRADLRPRHGRLADPEPAGHHVLLGAAAGRPQGHGLAGVLQAAAGGGPGGRRAGPRLRRIRRGRRASRPRSEERRVGEECVSTGRFRWSPDNDKKKKNNTT